SNPSCAGDADHTYFLDYVPDRTGPIRFMAGDWQYFESDNIGMLCIDITRQGLTHHDPETKQHSVLTVSDFINGATGS
ncbi:MAG: hypothetical protein LC723_13170, partial [Actinobacteria bacterium]|nr:hypothetical protein [Actinomycetota bacterium]